jgi:hypothetical protein
MFKTFITMLMIASLSAAFIQSPIRDGKHCMIYRPVIQFSDPAITEKKNWIRILTLRMSLSAKKYSESSLISA